MFNNSMNFALGDEIEALRVLTHRWAQENVKTIAAEIDVSNDFPSHLWGAAVMSFTKKLGIPFRTAKLF